MCVPQADSIEAELGVKTAKGPGGGIEGRWRIKWLEGLSLIDFLEANNL